MSNFIVCMQYQFKKIKHLKINRHTFHIHKHIPNTTTMCCSNLIISPFFGHFFPFDKYFRLLFCDKICICVAKHSRKNNKMKSMSVPWMNHRTIDFAWGDDVWPLRVPVEIVVSSHSIVCNYLFFSFGMTHSLMSL